MQLKDQWELWKSTFAQWRTDNVSRHAAALAFFTAISIAPFLLTLIFVTGFFWGEREEARAELMQLISTTTGPDAAQFIRTVLDSMNRPGVGSIAGIISVITLIWGSTHVFFHLQNSLNTLWGVKTAADQTIMAAVGSRFLSFAMVLIIAFLLLVSLIASTIINKALGLVGELPPDVGYLWPAVNFLVSLLVVVLVFAAIYKFLPDAHIEWRDVWFGAVVTGLLFTLGKFALSLYLGRISSIYGAAGSVIVFLFWVYYSAQLLFIGAEFTQVYANRYGSGIRVRHNSQRSNSREKAK